MNFNNLMLLDAQAATGGSGLIIILVYVAIFAALYFIMLRPQRKEQKQKAQHDQIGDRERQRDR